MPAKQIEEIRPALIAIGFLAMPAKLFHFPLHAETLLAGFFAAFAVYLADHQLPAPKPHSWPLILGCSALFAGFAWRSEQFYFPGILFYILLALVYVIPLLPQKKRLQDIPVLRVTAIVTGWACIPLLMFPFPHSGHAFIYLLGMSSWMLPAVIWSDLADKEDDLATGRLTWILSKSPRQRRQIVLSALMLSLGCFIAGEFWIMVPAPLLYAVGFRFLNHHPQHSDWILLWPLIGQIVT
ncbi:hypothetical protein P0Y35_02435 [Kiritimatiellaeota bacterium B1221]|nr:hypothetical protein [Kiritimatiellaeota bacterium B1221]